MAKRTVRGVIQIKCDACNGDGHDERFRNCKICFGAGFVSVRSKDGFKIESKKEGHK